MKYSMEEMIPVVKYLTERYTSKESTSVTYETARKLMEAAIYCIHYEEEGVEIKEKQETQIRTSEDKIPVLEAYETGYQVVLNKVMRTKKIYDDIVDEFKDYGNVAYYDTVILGMPEFFIRYDPRFGPQDHLLTLDYPLLDYKTNLTGINKIYHYLTCIQLEQIYLKKFPDNYIQEVLATYHKNYKDLVINLCSIVLRKNLICLMLEKEVGTIIFNADDCERIKQEVLETDKNILWSRFHTCLKVLLQKGWESNPSLLWYLQLDIHDFTAELINAASNNNIGHLI